MLTGVKAKNSQKGKASIDEALDYSSIYWSLVGSGLDSYLDTKIINFTEHWAWSSFFPHETNNIVFSGHSDSFSEARVTYYDLIVSNLNNSLLCMT